MDIKKKLFEMQDIGYRDFHAKLMPTVDKEKIIGIRIPVLRKFAKEIVNTPYACEFMSALPHEYYEENNLHAFLIAEIKDFDECIAELEVFLPYINNWATCDSLRPECFKSNTDRLLRYIYKWLGSDKPYTVRFAIEVLMVYYLDERFKPEYMDSVSKIKSDEYYVNMMIAWYFATALAKQYEAAIPYIKSKTLSPWVHNKTISKAIDSYRISKETKEYLKTMKQKSDVA